MPTTRGSVKGSSHAPHCFAPNSIASRKSEMTVQRQANCREKETRRLSQEDHIRRSHLVEIVFETGLDRLGANQEDELLQQRRAFPVCRGKSEISSGQWRMETHGFSCVLLTGDAVEVEERRVGVGNAACNRQRFSKRVKVGHRSSEREGSTLTFDRVRRRQLIRLHGPICHKQAVNSQVKLSATHLSSPS
jgi:hypothetical protein